MVKKLSSKAALTKFGAALLTTLIVLTISNDLIIPISPLNRLEQKFIDYRFEERGTIEFNDSADVIILEITQDAYDQIPSPFNSWPWPRKYFAKVIENLNEAGAKVIGIDILMANPDKHSVDNDSLLFNTIKKYKNIVLAGKIDIEAEASIERSNETMVRSISENYSNLFYNADSSIGIVQAVSDQDGVYRRYTPYVYSQVHDKKIPTFAYAALNKFYDKPSLYTAGKKEDYFIYKNVEIPEYGNSTILINYYGPNGTFPRIKFIDVLDDSEFQTIDEIEFEIEINTWDNPEYGLKNSGIFKDKIVFIGSTMPEDKDLVPVSFSSGSREGDNLLYGVEYHANAAQNFLDQNFLSRPNETIYTLLLIILTIGFFYLTSAAKRLKTRRTFVVEIIAILLVIVSIYFMFEFAIYLFSNQNLVIPFVYPAIAIVMGYVGSTTFEFFTERKRSSMMKGMFSQYVSENLVNELIENPDKLTLGGEKKVLTILFSDIAGFTSFSEGKKPEEVVAFINQFLDEMTDSVLNYNGTLDKYLGDSVMAFWGAPVNLPDHAELACKCALDMEQKLIKLNDKWGGANNEIKMRIGINTGEVLVGNIGGKKRFDYTVMGDNVNLASRLEGVNKNYNTSIIMSEETNEFVKSKLITREIDTVRVKGRAKPTKLFELMGIRKSGLIEKYNDYHKGLEFYKSADFAKAIKLFEAEILKTNDPVSKIYLKRCEDLIANPPKDQWDAVTTLSEK
ncbi:MAG: adenylate/guanylate cyclase domain-containing protein [Melioribacteraceae bacterium]|nr:adenylate/guanylate cyclase domain-containing protein [Melioribacteraceae bacterium]